MKSPREARGMKAFVEGEKRGKTEDLERFSRATRGAPPTSSSFALNQIKRDTPCGS
ncbi:hypothetical protein PCAR4_620050 [Paraburkholderia caribensis]|nr:hypothetical protein PCAR4_620050 [Paraburkholderia caribensis]